MSCLTLDTLLPGYRGFGCADKRLTEFSNLDRGCGGVALLWRSSLPVTPVTALKSDWITAVQVSINNTTSLSVVGVYLPSLENPIDVYREYITELENFVSTLQAYGPTLIIGDFNAHLNETLMCSTNVQGQLVEDLCCHLDLYPVSLSELSSGPGYTYFCGNHYTTVDYFLLDCWAGQLVRECKTLDHHPLNLSDRLPVTLKVDINPVRCSDSDSQIKLNWRRGHDIGSL